MNILRALHTTANRPRKKEEDERGGGGRAKRRVGEGGGPSSLLLILPLFVSGKNFSRKSHLLPPRSKSHSASASSSPPSPRRTFLGPTDPRERRPYTLHCTVHGRNKRKSCFFPPPSFHPPTKLPRLACKCGFPGERRERPREKRRAEYS